jgi:hypothetical protein
MLSQISSSINDTLRHAFASRAGSRRSAALLFRGSPEIPVPTKVAGVAWGRALVALPLGSLLSASALGILERPSERFAPRRQSKK